MGHHSDSARSGHARSWFLMTLGAGAVAGAAWLVARYRRDRLVAEAGAVVHPVPDDADDADVASGARPAGDGRA